MDPRLDTKFSPTVVSGKLVFNTVVDAKGDEPSIMISASTSDRVKDVLEPDGVVLDNYRKNPVVLYAHDAKDLPVGTTTSIEVSPGVGLRARWKWLEGDARAARVRNAFDQGAIRGASVGFIAIEKEPILGGGLRFKKWELIEWSLTPVPMNGSAVRDQADAIRSSIATSSSVTSLVTSGSVSGSSRKVSATVSLPTKPERAIKWVEGMKTPAGWFVRRNGALYFCRKTTWTTPGLDWNCWKRTTPVVRISV